MQICYVDEAGDTGAFDQTNPLSQPVLVLTGVFIRQEQLAQLTRDVMLLKQRFFPNRKNIAPHWHDWLQVEVKGADLRRVIRDGAANEQRRVLRFLDQPLRLLERYGIQLTSRIDLKTALDDFDGTTTYSSAVQRFVETFEHRLVEASHVAIATIAKMDYLATWNCKHINNPQTLPKIIKVCEENGFKCPLIGTPDQLEEVRDENG